MTNRSCWKISGTLATLPWLPGFLMSVIALVQKWSKSPRYRDWKKIGL